MYSQPVFKQRWVVILSAHPLVTSNMEVISALYPVYQPSWCCSDICMTSRGNCSPLRVSRRCPGCRPFLACLTPTSTVYVLCSFFSVWTVGHPSTIPFKAFLLVSVDSKLTNFNRRQRKAFSDLPSLKFFHLSSEQPLWFLPWSPASLPEELWPAPPYSTPSGTGILRLSYVSL